MIDSVSCGTGTPHIYSIYSMVLYQLGFSRGCLLFCAVEAKYLGASQF
jgi:hypothetical protein